MGLGTLFIGYFLLLNLAYYELTDAICGAVMLYAFYKLKNVNSGFSRGMVSAAVFAVFGLIELIFAVIGLNIPVITFARPIIRHGIICVTTFLMLIGLRDVAREVGLSEIAARCQRNFYFTGAAYILNVFLEAAGLASLFAAKILAFLYLFATLLTIAVIILNLISIYSCYMRICMPGDSFGEEKKSRFAFVNEMRAHQEEKEREYREYRLEKLKEKNKERKKKK